MNSGVVKITVDHSSSDDEEKSIDVVSSGSVSSFSVDVSGDSVVLNSVQDSGLRNPVFGAELVC